MSETQLEIVLKKRLSDAALGYPIGWPNQFIDDPSNFPYLIVDMMRGANQRLGTKGSDPEYRNGIFQISVLTQFGTSTRVANQICDQIATVFPAGLRMTLTTGGYVDVMRDPEVSAGYRDDAAWRTPISIYYRGKF